MMNPQIPGYSAVYANPGVCSNCQQTGMGAYNNAMTIQMPGKTKADPSSSMDTSMQGAGAGGSMQTAVIPSAMQQPAIQGAVMGTAGVGQASTPATAQLMPITDMTQSAPMTAESIEFLNGFLRTQIGRRVRVEFLIGTNTFTDKAGLLVGVGANYILLREAESDDILTCDFFNIKFVTIFY
ncbi:hypothetical protein CAFE_14710 [Caprobacter fermentans]|uniref:Uncharacterized protein n=2 Tax=Caproicibacter fermentans TaxID=2576756 RepID=A0A6N8HZM6_9FIRM|nr:hypothetical protein [Caproicibacter fermentans]MVB10773.1 hypothetical protein [Caproicibacter fermentans]